jgi:hypothetical protein
MFVLVRQRYRLFSYSPNNEEKNKPVIPTGIQSNYYEKTTNLNDESKNLLFLDAKVDKKKSVRKKNQRTLHFLLRNLITGWHCPCSILQRQE